MAAPHQTIHRIIRCRSEKGPIFRGIRIAHEDHRHDGVVRELSKSGAAIERLLGVPTATSLVPDLGGD